MEYASTTAGLKQGLLPLLNFSKDEASHGTGQEAGYQLNFRKLEAQGLSCSGCWTIGSLVLTNISGGDGSVFHCFYTELEIFTPW